MNILVIEDDKTINAFISRGLKEEGWAVMSVHDGAKGLEAARSGRFDMVILDLMLPGTDGVSICRELRLEKNPAAVIMLTAKDAVSDRVDGLDAGADDYIVKPFAFTELLARIRAVMRRREGKAANQIEVTGLVIDAARHRVAYKSREETFTHREFMLLHIFMSRPGHVLSRTALIESAWGFDFQAETNVIDVYVNFLRRKLRKLTGRDWIRTIRGRGYVFDPESA